MGYWYPKIIKKRKIELISRGVNLEPVMRSPKQKKTLKPSLTNKLKVPVNLSLLPFIGTTTEYVYLSWSTRAGLPKPWFMQKVATVQSTRTSIWKRIESISAPCKCTWILRIQRSMLLHFFVRYRMFICLSTVWERVFSFVTDFLAYIWCPIFLLSRRPNFTCWLRPPEYPLPPTHVNHGNWN